MIYSKIFPVILITLLLLCSCASSKEKTVVQVLPGTSYPDEGNDGGDDITVIVITFCSNEGYPHKNGDVNECETWYVNCIMGHGNGSWNAEDVGRCHDEAQKSATFKIQE